MQMYLDRFVFHESGLRSMLAAEGHVGRDLVRRAIRVEGAAKRNASGRPGPNVITGRLRASISWRFGKDAESIYVDIGTAVEYAPYVERSHPYLLPALSDAGV